MTWSRVNKGLPREGGMRRSIQEGKVGYLLIRVKYTYLKYNSRAGYYYKYFVLLLRAVLQQTRRGYSIHVGLEHAQYTDCQRASQIV